MNLISFTKQFPNEESCRQHLKEQREKQGIVCSKCGCVHHYWKKNRNEWQCKKCGHRTTLTSGTVMHGTKLPIIYWYIAMHLLTSTKKSFSALEMQRQLGHNRYQPIWELMHKLRNVMGQRDAEYQLCGSIELDEGFFSTQRDETEKDKPLKAGRGSQKKAKVLVMAESTPVEGSKMNIKKQVGHIKMVVIPNLKASTIDVEVVDNIKKESSLITDASSSYVHFKNLVNEHVSQVIEPKEVGKVLPWVHIVISNAKRLLLDIYHDVKSEFLQSYLNEFCYKFNRRNMNCFECLMFAALCYQTEFKHISYRK
ncbi:IS1595 family transposase [Bacteroides sp. KH569_7]|uniref:IS1595 family transposase n=1 Tax=Bacteroides muris (ex Fokt et al. 2023) TaxID=2937417 RepID=A0A9X2NXU6_9BACE|nr:IS1595 family transposase [Bacteroides muris (ex Fokt et al. 2023)]MCR6507041.1 IS1595 family transposase [Bacteroides muris (ex Fokt et al. 2023)]